MFPILIEGLLNDIFRIQFLSVKMYNLIRNSDIILIRREVTPLISICTA